MAIDAIDSLTVRGYLGLLHRKNEKATIARKLSALRTFVSWAMDFGHISENPVPDDFSPPAYLYLPHTLSEQDVEAILKSADGTSPEDIRDKAVLEVLYATGMRVSELVALDVDATPAKS